MKTSRNRCQGITLIELVICAAIVFVLLGMLLPSGHRPSRMKSIRCLSNLKQIGIGFVMSAEDHQRKFPMQISTNSGGTLEFDTGATAFRHFQALKPYLGKIPKVLVCPSDPRQSASRFDDASNSNLSYFINLDANLSQPNVFLTGDRFIKTEFAPRTGVLFVGTNSSLNWSSQHEKKSANRGNVTLVSGSSTGLRNADLQRTFNNSKASSARLCLPE